MFLLPASVGVYGYIVPEVVKKMPWGRAFEVHHQSKVVMPITERGSGDIGLEVSLMIDKMLIEARTKKVFSILRGWRDELYPIIGSPGVKMERAGSALLGILTLGVHMTAYTYIEGQMRIWVPRRSATKETYGGMLDNTVAGGISANERPLDCLIREATEEASLPEELVRRRVKACGTVSYFHIRDERAGGESGLMQPEIQYVYDLELPQNVVPMPGDNEVQEFYLFTLGDIKDALEHGEFKPNCVLVLLDFLIRQNILTAENEHDYADIVSRIHRKLPFPVPKFRIG
jgi:8-oxo-dGTP pyrophosphatase MutT (NUDIX family)